MRLSRLALATTKETPADAEIVSHQLMLRAGMIRRLGAGLYTWSPLGMRVLRKVEAIIRAEMTAIDALEILMPAVQPAELWQESGRWQAMGPLMLRMTDRAEREYCFGPTHEEVVTDYIKRDVRSYKQLPLTVYQIQTKFRDEIRPRFGLMRAREFIMKDAYSFHMDEAGLDREYQAMRGAYAKILDRMGLDYRVVAADSGAIGGAKSEEFHVLAHSGEDELAVASEGGYAANIEAAPIMAELDRRGWTLSQVWLTHHHPDHVQGLAELLTRFPAEVIGAKADAHRLPPLDRDVAEGDTVELGALKAEVLDVSGHTVGHIAFHVPQAKAAFTADSLMALGCGRLFEGDMRLPIDEHWQTGIRYAGDATWPVGRQVLDV